jgi:hypothetical protein
LYRKYNHIHLLFFLLLPSPSCYCLTCFSFPPLYVSCLVGCFLPCILSVHTLCLSQCNLLHCTSLPFSSILCCLTVFSVFPSTPSFVWMAEGTLWQWCNSLLFWLFHGWPSIIVLATPGQPIYGFISRYCNV